MRLNGDLSRRSFLKLAGAASASLALPHLSGVGRSQISSAAPIIVDAHVDLGYNIVNFGRDYTRSALDIRADTAGTPAQRVQGQAMLGLPELLAGRMALVWGVIYVMPQSSVRSPLQIANYGSPDEAAAWGQVMHEAILDFIASSDHLMLVKNQTDLDVVLESWEQDIPDEERRVGVMLAMEGADPIRSPDELAAWYAGGLRSVGLSWGRTQYAGSNSMDGPLTTAGVELLERMREYNMIFDTAHLSEAAFWDAMSVWDDVVVNSHSALRHYLPTERGFSDDQIRAIIERDGVFGIGLYNGFYEQNTRNAFLIVLDDVLDAITYVCELAGNCDHVAIGSDLDGGFGAELAPQGIDTIADLQQIPTGLKLRGFSDAQIDAICHGNWLRILRQSLPEGVIK